MKHIIIFFTFIIFLLQASETWACSCAGPGTPKLEFEESKAVFSSQTREFKKDKNGNIIEVVLYLDKVWKGDPPKQYKIDISQLRSGCAYWGFKENSAYLIYAHKSWDKDDPNNLTISMCSRTKPLNKAQIETRYLDAIMAGQGTNSIDQSLPEILISNQPPNVRAEAANILGWKMRHDAENIPAGTVGALVKAAQSPETEVKLAVAQNLRQRSFHDKPGVKEALLYLLKDQDLNVRNAAVGAFGTVGKGDNQIFKALVQTLKEDKKKQWKDIKRYETALASLGSSIAEVAKTDEEKAETASILHDLIDDISDPMKKVSIIQPLGFLQEHAQKSAPKLLEVLKSSNHYHLKQYTLNALGDIKAINELENIKSYLKNENCYVLTSTVNAVYKIDPKGFSDFFKNQAMPEMKSRYESCEHQIIWGLQTIGLAASEMEPFMTEKYQAMSSEDWKKDSLKTLLDTWHANVK